MDNDVILINKANLKKIKIKKEFEDPTEPLYLLGDKLTRTINGKDYSFTCVDTSLAQSTFMCDEITELTVYNESRNDGNEYEGSTIQQKVKKYGDEYFIPNPSQILLWASNKQNTNGVKIFDITNKKHNGTNKGYWLTPMANSDSTRSASITTSTSSSNNYVDTTNYYGICPCFNIYANIDHYVLGSKVIRRLNGCDYYFTCVESNDNEYIFMCDSRIYIPEKSSWRICFDENGSINYDNSSLKQYIINNFGNDYFIASKEQVDKWAIADPYKKNWIRFGYETNAGISTDQRYYWTTTVYPDGKSLYLISNSTSYKETTPKTGYCNPDYNGNPGICPCFIIEK